MTKHRPGRQGPLVALLGLFVIPPFFLTYRSLSAGNAPGFVPIGIDWIFLPPEFQSVDQAQRDELPESQHVVTIPYAVSITSCKKRELVMDGASVLQHSIHLNSIRTPSSGSHYDYEMVAFVHPDAVECTDILEILNYTVLLKEVPFDVSQIRGPYRGIVNRSGCCGEKEWLKLYSYTLTQYPVVVHLDLDCLVLKPFDDLFDAMIMPAQTTNDTNVASARARIPAMWVNATDLPETIDFFFTRDYGMLSEPGHKKVPQIGVQGGFLVLRPNVASYQEFIDLILEGFYSIRHGWGGKLGFGGYYGAGTIQGLAAMFYSHLHPEGAVELNRCIYNNMADAPYPRRYDKAGASFPKPYPCITEQETCEDCREKKIDDIYSIHLTNCFKPWHCVDPVAVRTICSQFYYEWYRIRSLVEAKWRGEEIHLPRIKVKRKMTIQDISFGFCNETGPKGYSPIEQNYKSIFVK